MKKHFNVFTMKIPKMIALLSVIILFTTSVSAFGIDGFRIAPPTPESDPTNVQFSQSGSMPNGVLTWSYEDPVSDPVLNSYQFIVEQSSDAGANWASAGSVGFVDGTFTYSLPVSGLADQTTYEFRVKIQNVSDATNESGFVSSNAVTIQLLTGGNGLTVSQIFNDYVILSISDNVSGEEGYRIYYRPVGAAAYSVNPDFQVTTSGQIYNLGFLAANTNYEAYVAAFNGSQVINSNVVTFKTKRNAPPTPSYFIKTTLCPDKVVVYWSNPDVSQIDVSYVIDEVTGQNVSGFLNASNPSAIIGGLSPNTYYQLVYVVENETGKSYGGPLKFVTPGYTAPNPPTNFAGPFNVTTNSFDVTWTSGTEDQECKTNLIAATTMVLILEYPDGTGDTLYKPLFTNSNRTTVTEGLLPKTKVNVVIRHENAQGFSYAGPLVFTTLGPPNPPSAGAAVYSKDVLGDKQVELTWGDNSDDEDGFVIEVSVNGGAFTKLATVKSNTTKFFHKPVIGGNTYTYKVKSFNVYGDSFFYSDNSEVILEVTDAPNAPYNVKATADASSVTVTWLDDSAYETSFVVLRSEDEGVTWTEVGTVNANVLSYVDNNVTNGLTYWYGVKAVNALGDATSTKYAKVTIGTTSGGTMGLNAYPNPTVDVVNLTLDESFANAKTTIQVIDDNNRIVLTKTLRAKSNEVSVDMSSLKTGMYKVVVSANDTRISRKVFKN